MTIGDRIVEAGYRVLRREVRPVAEPGYCLAFVRQLVELALGLPNGEFYRTFVDPHFRTRPGEREGVDISPRWARGVERAMRDAGLWVPPTDASPGDLVFSHRVSRPYGHVAILMPGGMVIENTYADRGWRTPGLGAVRYTPLRRWDPVTTVIRIVLR